MVITGPVVNVVVEKKVVVKVVVVVVSVGDTVEVMFIIVVSFHDQGQC